MPRILHVSDTHLGIQSYNRVTSDGLNQREVDAQDAFQRVVDAAIARPPDLFLHTGDLFDHPRPNNRAIAFALNEIRRLSEAKIPTILVSGNHDAPRMRETGSIFRIFDGLPHVRSVYRGERELIRVGDLAVHAVPQAITQEAFQTQIHACDPAGPGLPVLAVHGTVLGVDGLFTSEFNEYQIPMSLLRPEFRYTALGHFHNHKRVAENAYYSGSSESHSFAEANQPKVWLEADVSPDGASVVTQETESRPMIDLGTMDASGLTREGLEHEVATLIKGAPAQSVARLTLERLDRSLARTIDWEGLRALRTDLCYLELRPRMAEEGHSLDGAVELGPLSQEFESFLARYPLPDADRSRVRDEALEALAGGGGATRAA